MVVLKQKASMQEMNLKAQALHLENGEQPYEQMRLNIPNQTDFNLFFFSIKFLVYYFILEVPSYLKK